MFIFRIYGLYLLCTFTQSCLCMQSNPNQHENQSNSDFYSKAIKQSNPLKQPITSSDKKTQSSSQLSPATNTLIKK